MGVKKNTAYNLSGAIAPAGLMLISVPFYLGIVGEARYGVLAIVWLLTGYFGVFDFGLGQATAYKVARLKDAKKEEGAETLWTAISINLVFGIAGGAIIFVLAPILFERVFNTPDELLLELRPAYFWIALAIPIATLEGVFSGALMGRSQFLTLNIRAILGAFLVQFVPLLAVIWVSPSLSIAVPATVLARGLGVGIFAVLAFRVLGASFLPSIAGISLFKEMLSYGGWVTLGKSILQLVGNLDRLVIAAILTPLAVTFYTIPFQLISRGGQIPRALASAMFPDFAQNGEAKARELALMAIRANIAAMTIICLFLMAAFRPFLSLWISPDFAEQAGLVASLLTFSLWVNGVAIVAIMFLEAQGRPKTTFLISAIQAPPYAMLVFAGVLFGGIVGVALARNVRSVLDAALLCHFGGLLRPVIPFTIVPAILLATSVALNGMVHEWAFLAFGNLALLGCCLFVSARLFPEGLSLIAQGYQTALTTSLKRPKS